MNVMCGIEFHRPAGRASRAPSGHGVCCVRYPGASPRSALEPRASHRSAPGYGLSARWAGGGRGHAVGDPIVIRTGRASRAPSGHGLFYARYPRASRCSALGYNLSALWAEGGTSSVDGVPGGRRARSVSGAHSGHNVAGTAIPGHRSAQPRIVFFRPVGPTLPAPNGGLDSSPGLGGATPWDLDPNRPIAP